MLKRLILIILSITVLIPVQAQFSSLIKGIDEIEIIAGPSLVSFGGVGSSQLNRIKGGYSFGLIASWHLVGRIAISTKLLYERKGINRHYSGKYFDETVQQYKIGDSKESWNFDYISLPITLRYALNRRKNIFIETGLYVAYLQKAQVIANYLYNNRQTTSSQKDLFTPFDFGITSSIGYSLPLKMNINMNIRLFGTYGLIDISHYGSNTDFQVAHTESVGIVFGVSKKIKK